MNNSLLRKALLKYISLFVCVNGTVQIFDRVVYVPVIIKQDSNHNQNYLYLFKNSMFKREFFYKTIRCDNARNKKSYEQ